MKRLVAGLLFCSSLAWAHGGLPVSQRILRQAGGDTMYVPVIFWGVWVGQPGQPWKWICEEEINNYKQRRMVLSTDGTFYTSDARGLTISTDHGCTWRSFQGELTQKRVTDLTVHPTDGATAWVASGDGTQIDADGGEAPPDNALYVTHDHGGTFQRVPGLASSSARMFQGVRVAPSDASVIYVTSESPTPPFAPILHRSVDGGTTFTDLPVGYQIDGNPPSTIEPFAVDPRDPQVVWLRVTASTTGASKQALLRSADGGATFAEILVLDGMINPSGSSYGIDGLAIDAANGKVYAATAQGVYAGTDPGGAATVTLAKTGNLSQAQCIDVHGGSVYACSNNYAPDNAALAQSDDGAQSFSSILRYVDTEGPIDCPAGTPVGDNCPFYWLTYGSQLGIEFTDGGLPVRDMGDSPGGSGGCSCDLGAGGTGLGAALAMMVLLALLARRMPRS
jgi:hypothetical protein